MTYTAIILLLALGVILLLLEFLVIPGTTIAGIGGLLCLGGGVYMSYNNFGTTIGNYTLLGTVLFLVFSVYYMLKSKTWKKLSLNTYIDSKVDIVDETKVKAGDKGKTITRCNPVGKALVNNEQFEAKSLGSFIDHDTEIEVIKVIRNQIVIKPIN